MNREESSLIIMTSLLMRDLSLIKVS